MGKTRVMFRTGRKLGMTIAIFPGTIDGDKILAYDEHHYTASESSIMKHTRPATVDELEDLFHELKRFHCKNEILAIRKKCVKIERHGK